MAKLERVLIANRGEIAVRIIRAAKSLGIETVAVYSEPDEECPHVRLADRRIALRGSTPKDTYLNLDKLVLAAIQSGSDCVHPGYGFFAENAAFARAMIDEGLTYIGPSPDAIATMADKEQARLAVQKFSVPVVPGTAAGISADEVSAFGKRVGFPLMIKAAAGGSGRGMRVVKDANEVAEKMGEASREAEAAFSDGRVFAEKYIEQPRHIEVQIFGDSHGNIVHFHERECSLQRRHQKLVEETPAPGLHAKVRERLFQAALSAGRSVNYQNAGTVEFLVEGGREPESPIYFLEMNTRIQVEHPVTEETTGVDLVRLQFLVAQGAALPSQAQIQQRGHAVEFRVNAEDVNKSFMPVTGTVSYVSRPGGRGMREDGWIESGMKISPYYDSLLSKVIVTGSTREETLERSRAVLSEFNVEGVPTTLDFHRWLLEREEYIEGRVDIGWVEREYSGGAHPASFVGPMTIPNKKTAKKTTVPAKKSPQKKRKS